ncbi:MAG: ABC transporter ATP-binding protein [Nitrospira sp.]|nr:ATP-binding cassette domain-containing protein [Candidatus Manganitrophaceae bacterium]HIL34852.1 ATP-binding cassette domain-containing protein [Candidatus Manganitrophaceae bacterium]
MPAIKVTQLTKTFKTHRKEAGLKGSFKGLFSRKTLYKEAVKSVSFTLKEGELVGFLGPNGAGKTTLLKMLSGILYPTSGEAKVLGFTPWQRDREYQRQFSIVMGHKNQLWWDLPPSESFLLNRDIYDVNPLVFQKSIDEMVDLLKLKDILDVPVRQLSLGERMKCELVAALLHQPRVLFLDEPTIGLDVISQEKIRSFIQEYNRLKKTTVLLTSHYMQDVEQLCKRVLVINHGRIAFDGMLSDLSQRYGDHKVIKVRFADAQTTLPLPGLEGVEVWDAHHAVVKVQKKEVAHITQRLLEGYHIEDLSVEEVEIEEVIRRIFEESPEESIEKDHPNGVEDK